MTDTPQEGGTQKRIVDKDRFVEIGLDQLAFAPWNYKLDDDVKLGKLINNIKVNGQVENLIVRQLPTGFFEVVNGNHRLEAFRRMGVDRAVCYDLGVVSDVAARRLAIETNETRFEADAMKLADMIRAIEVEVGTEDLLTTMPYTEAQLKELMHGLDVDWEKISADLERDKQAKGGDGGTEQGAELCTCPSCGYEFER